MRQPKPSRPSGREAGYALLMVVFLAAVMLISVVAVAPRALIQGQREKEEELVWRGEQYVRAVRLYHRKFGRFPQSVEDLTKGKNQLRFLRKPYTDPINSADGSWRMIYVTPTGQLIGSLKHHSPLRLPGPQGLPTAARRATPRVPDAAARARPGTEQQTAEPSMSATPPGSSTGASAQSSTQSQQSAEESDASSKMDAGPEAKVVGGNIIGIGSKVDRHSLRVLDGATNYREWEFIWDPSKEAVVVPSQPTTPPGNQPNRPSRLQNPSPRPQPQ